MSKIIFNNQQIFWGGSKINILTQFNILELQCFYTTINSICLFHQIICQKTRVDITTCFTNV